MHLHYWTFYCHWPLIHFTLFNARRLHSPVATIAFGDDCTHPRALKGYKQQLTMLWLTFLHLPVVAWQLILYFGRTFYSESSVENEPGKNIYIFMFTFRFIRCCRTIPDAFIINPKWMFEMILWENVFCIARSNCVQAAPFGQLP